MRNAIITAIAFGVTAAVAGFVWTALEFPPAILLPAAIGWFVATRWTFGPRLALRAAVVGGLSFALAFLVAGAMRAAAPAAADVEGPTQYAYFALTLGVIGLIQGAAVGLGVDRVALKAASGR